jgi:superfamily I DNA/RNA helicase
MEQRVIGPPGCGKTTWLSRQVQRAVGEGKDVLVASLTRAAAAEAAGRNLPIPPRNVGTLHSHCYQSLGRPTLAVDKKHVEDWNSRHPEWALTASDES